MSNVKLYHFGLEITVLFRMVVNTVDMSLGFASTIGAYDTTEYSGLYSERELLYPVQNGIT
jgi:hypothetical protein